MASSGSKSTTFLSDNKLTWSWQVASLSPATGEATIAWTATVTTGKKRFSHSGTATWGMDIMDFDKVKGSYDGGNINNLDIPANTTEEIASGTFVIGHTTAAYGRTTVDFSLTSGGTGDWFEQNGITVSLTSVKVTCGFTLDAPFKGGLILSAPNFTDEDNPVIQYSLDYLSISSLTASITVGSYTLTRSVPIVSSGSYTFSLTSTERQRIIAQVTDSVSKTATFKLTTVPAQGVAGIEHSINKLVTITNAAPVLSPTYANNTDFTYILSGKNSITVKSNATARKGATIVSQVISCGNQKINTGSGTLTDIQSDTIHFLAIDSRGYQSAASLTIDLTPYIPLSCNIESTNPVNNADGSITVTFNISGAFFNGSFNDGGSGNALTLYYRATIDGTDGEWTWIDKTIDGNSYSTSVSFTLNRGQQITLSVIATDNVDRITSILESKELIPTFDWCSTDFNFNVPVTIEGHDVVYIIESGSFYSNGNFYWRKWSDGTSELWGECSFSTAFNTAWGSLYTSGAISSTNISFPSGLFTETPAIVAQLRTRSTGAFLMVPGGSGSNISSSTNTGPYELVRPAQYSTVSAFTICYNIKGRWK